MIQELVGEPDCGQTIVLNEAFVYSQDKYFRTDLQRKSELQVYQENIEPHLILEKFERGGNRKKMVDNPPTL